MPIHLAKIFWRKTQYLYFSSTFVRRGGSAHRSTSWESGGRGAVAPKKITKMNVFGQKKWRNLGKNKSHEFYLYITYSSGRLYLLLQKWISLNYQFNLTSWSLFSIERDKRNKLKHISQVQLCLFTKVWLLALKAFP